MMVKATISAAKTIALKTRAVTKVAVVADFDSSIFDLENGR
jgi:hypothetical protein